MKLIVNIKRLDDKWEKHTCNDFPSFGAEFVTLFKEGFKREMIRIASIVECNYSIENG